MKTNFAWALVVVLGLGCAVLAWLQFGSSQATTPTVVTAPASAPNEIIHDDGPSTDLRAPVQAPAVTNTATDPTPVAAAPLVEERYPDAPGTPGQLPFSSGSIEERAWILRRQMRDLQDLKGEHERFTKLGAMLATGIGGILTLQGRQIEVPQGRFVMPRAADDEYVFKSQSQIFVFKKYEFPDYSLYHQALEADGDWTLLGDKEQWFERSHAWIEESIGMLEASFKK